MQTTWQVQEAKNRFSELIEMSLRHGAQTVTRHGRPIVQIVPILAPITAPTVGNSPNALAAGDAFTAHLLNAPKSDAGLTPPKRRNRRAALDLGI